MDVAAHLPLVRALARRMSAHVPAHVAEFEDLVSMGAMGLIDAASRFEEGRGASFSSWAFTRIRGSMVDGLRSAGLFRRGDVQRHKSGGGVKFEGLRALRSHAVPADESLELEQEVGQLLAALAQLETDDRRAIEGYWFDGLQLDELGARFGVGKAQMCRRLKRAEDALRAALGVTARTVRHRPEDRR